MRIEGNGTKIINYQLSRSSRNMNRRSELELSNG